MHSTLRVIVLLLFFVASLSAQNTQTGPLNVAGHINLTQATPPVASGCGGGAIAANSTDNIWKITGITTATACTVTFNSSIQIGACLMVTSSGLVIPGAVSTTSAILYFALLTGTITGFCF